MDTDHIIKTIQFAEKTSHADPHEVEYYLIIFGCILKDSANIWVTSTLTDQDLRSFIIIVCPEQAKSGWFASVKKQVTHVENDLLKANSTELSLML